MVGQVGQLPHQYFAVAVNGDVIMTSSLLHSAPPIISSRLPPCVAKSAGLMTCFLKQFADMLSFHLDEKKNPLALQSAVSFCVREMTHPGNDFNIT